MLLKDSPIKLKHFSVMFMLNSIDSSLIMQKINMICEFIDS